MYLTQFLHIRVCFLKQDVQILNQKTANIKQRLVYFGHVYDFTVKLTLTQILDWVVFNFIAQPCTQALTFARGASDWLIALPVVTAFISQR